MLKKLICFIEYIKKLYVWCWFLIFDGYFKCILENFRWVVVIYIGCVFFYRKEIFIWW